MLCTLADRDLLSEGRFVESFVRSRVELGQGPLRIRAELRDRGIEETVIDAALTRPSEFWLTQLERVRAKRFGAETATSRVEWTRPARFLAQRGFPSDLIYRTLDR